MCNVNMRGLLEVINSLRYMRSYECRHLSLKYKAVFVLLSFLLYKITYGKFKRVAL